MDFEKIAHDKEVWRIECAILWTANSFFRVPDREGWLRLTSHSSDKPKYMTEEGLKKLLTCAQKDNSLRAVTVWNKNGELVH